MIQGFGPTLEEISIKIHFKKTRGFNWNKKLKGKTGFYKLNNYKTEQNEQPLLQRRRSW
jgi:hypothetical protein